MSRRGRRVLVVVAVAAVTVVAVVAASASREPERVTASLAELHASPSTFMDRRIVVSGQVTDVIGPGPSLRPESPKAAGFVLGHDLPLLVVGVDLVDMAGPRGRAGSRKARSSRSPGA